jgi:hypothetical protein
MNMVTVAGLGVGRPSQGCFFRIVERADENSKL